MITEKALPLWRMPPFSDTLGKLNLARNGSAVLFGRFLVVDSSFGMACFRMFEGKTLDSKQGHVQNHRFWYRVLTVLQHTHVKKWRWTHAPNDPQIQWFTGGHWWFTMRWLKRPREDFKTWTSLMTLVCSSVSAGSDHPGFSIVEGNQVWVHQPLPPSRLREKYQHHGFKVLKDWIVKGDVPKYVGVSENRLNP